MVTIDTQGAGPSEALRRTWSRHGQLISVLALVLLALGLMSSRLIAPVRWSPDALFYQAQVYEVQGDSQAAALQRSFSSPAARELVVKYHDGATVGNPAWVRYSARFYRRRWVTPLLAAALSPAVGERALLDASVLGYVLIGLLLFALLRCRFGVGTSLAVAALMLLITPLRHQSGTPGADSWGLATEIGALLVAYKAVERGRGWLWLWPAVMLLMSFAKDASPIVIIALAGVAAVLRTRRSLAVLGLGVLAAIPAPAIFGGSLRLQLAYAIAGYRRPPSGSWSYVIDHFAHSAWIVIRSDLEWPANQSHAPVYVLIAACVAASVIFMCWRAPNRDSFFLLHKFALLGCVLTVAAALNYTGLRLELVFVPSVAVGLAFTIERLLSMWSGRRDLVTLPHASAG